MKSKIIILKIMGVQVVMWVQKEKAISKLVHTQC